MTRSYNPCMVHTWIGGDNKQLGSNMVQNKRKDYFQVSDNQSSKIRKMALSGMTNGEIAKKLNIRYQTVWRTLNRKFEGKIPQEELVLAGIRKVDPPLVDEETK
jgi:DNA invertase Pin-like site-specific DNA recombinase